MPATRPPAHLPGLPVTAVPAGQLEPGDLLLDARNTAPIRVWWRWNRAGGTHLLLAGSRHQAPDSRHCPHESLVTAVCAPGVLERDERATRLLCALRGGVWLQHLGHPAAPPSPILRHLLGGFAALTGLELAEAVDVVAAGLTRDVDIPPSVWRV